MTATNLQAFAKAAPFRPFYSKMADGTVHTFHHPELIAVRRVAALASAPKEGVFAVLDLALMKDVCPMPQPQGSPT